MQLVSQVVSLNVYKAWGSRVPWPQALSLETNTRADINQRVTFPRLSAGAAASACSKCWRWRPHASRKLSSRQVPCSKVCRLRLRSPGWRKPAVTMWQIAVLFSDKFRIFRCSPCLAKIWIESMTYCRSASYTALMHCHAISAVVTSGK